MNNIIHTISVVEDEFQMLQSNFMDKYYKEFEDTEENKFIYTDIHKEYVSKGFHLLCWYEPVELLNINEQLQVN